MRQRRCTDSMAVSSTPPMNGEELEAAEELQAAGRSPAVQHTIVGSALREAKSLFPKLSSFEGGRAALVVCVVGTGIGTDKIIISMLQILRC